MPRKPKPQTPFAELARSLAMSALYLNQLTVPAGLPPLSSLSVSWNYHAEAADVHAHVPPADIWDPDQEQQIEAMRAWAAALNGTFQLDDLHPTTAGTTGWARTLRVVAALPDGAQIKLRTMLNLATPPTAQPAVGESDAALAGVAR
jgi:hypothetical protein